MVGAATLMVATAACVPPPAPNPPLVVTTTADTFDGVCDDDCSLRDAIAEHNTRPPGPGGVANRISVPAGEYELALDEPLRVDRPLILSGAGASTVLDLRGTTAAAAFDAHATTVIDRIRVEGDPASTNRLVTCSGDVARTATVLNSTTDGLDAVIAGCDAVLVSTTVRGASAVHDVRSLNASGSTLPFDGRQLPMTRFGVVSSILTGPALPDGTTADGLVNVQPRPGLTIQAGFSGSRGDRVGVQLGGGVDGSVLATSLNSSFGLDGADGPLQLSVAGGSRLQVTASTVHGGGDGAFVAEGEVVITGSTVAGADRAVEVAEGGAVTLRRSVLSSTGPASCNAPVTSLGHNAIVGDGCGEPNSTDQSFSDESELLLGELDRHGGPTPSLAFLPAPTSPLVDTIPVGGFYDPDCPFDAAQDTGRSLDQRGVLRPVGAGCDVGAVELTLLEREA